MNAGSWTRGMQPDYTISIWPAGYSREDAERHELMAHIHFDAKYRVEAVRELLGDQGDDAVLEGASERTGAAKYADLLKMHAYRDAIRRTAGAYVLYPGRPGDSSMYRGYHEVLPGLGAFAVRPGAAGEADGIDAVATFLDDVVSHLANRTTARERVTYHLAEAYAGYDGPVSYGRIELPEHCGEYGKEFRALPPAEEMVLVAWYRNDAQLELARDGSGFFYVRLGRRHGALLVHPNLARVRRIILHTDGGAVAPGMLLLREPGFRVYTRRQLRIELQKHAKGRGVAAWQASAGPGEVEALYALFRTSADPAWGLQEWGGEALLDALERFESDIRNRPVENVGRASANPRILPLQDALRAMAHKGDEQSPRGLIPNSPP